MLLPCSCSHEYQDKRFGKGLRWHNPGKDKARCTVCGNVKVRGSSNPREPSGKGKKK